MRTSSIVTSLLLGSSLASLASLAGCAVAGDAELGSTAGDSWEDFRASTYREDWAGGHFIVDGDIGIKDEKALYEFWQNLQDGALIVNTKGGNDDRWNDQEKLALTYCISNNFGSNKQKMIDAMIAATDDGWETMGNVNFIYVPAQDGNCTAQNNQVLFSVRQVAGQPYLARAFFPSSPKPSREVLVDTSSFDPGLGWPLKNIIAHELGHTLGFRHEHTRPEAGACFEDNNWRPLTAYDAASVMHYPQCNGTSNALDFTATDAAGIAALYGAPTGGGGSEPPPPPPPAEHSETITGSVASKQMVQLGYADVAPGTLFTVVMTGTGDPDLYVRWNDEPTTTQFNCRPYLDGPDEECSMTVPSSAQKAFVAVRGYVAGTYDLTVTWTAP